MRNETCLHEDSVIQAVHTGQWSEKLRIHLSQCKSCTEAAKVTLWMGRMAASRIGAEPLPDPGLTWLKSQLAEQQRFEQLALRPMILAHAVAASCLTAALSFLIFRSWPAVNEHFSKFLTLLPDALIHPSISSIGSPIAYLVSPLLILSYLASGCLVLLPKLRRISR
jgi:hypothetical protein